MEQTPTSPALSDLSHWDLPGVGTGEVYETDRRTDGLRISTDFACH